MLDIPAGQLTSYMCYIFLVCYSYVLGEGGRGCYVQAVQCSAVHTGYIIEIYVPEKTS